MGRRVVQVSARHRRAVNQAVVFAKSVPPQILVDPAVFVRGFRSALRMSQGQLAHRCGLARSHIAELEAGVADARVGTLRRIFAAMFCDMLILPLARQRPGDVVADRELERPYWRGIWD